MPWVPHTFVIPWDVVWYWGCVPAPEQHASRQIAAVALLPFPYALADVVDLEFQVASPLWWEKRRDAWKGNWQIVESEIDIDGTTVRVYSCDAAWPGLLFGCISDGGCAAGDSACPCRPTYSEAGA